jgi:hypothetical protein
MPIGTAVAWFILALWAGTSPPEKKKSQILISKSETIPNDQIRMLKAFCILNLEIGICLVFRAYNLGFESERFDSCLDLGFCNLGFIWILDFDIWHLPLGLPRAFQVLAMTERVWT